MRVLFDGYWLDGGPPSGRNVVDSLVSAWSELFPRDELSVVVPAESPAVPSNVRQVVRTTFVRNHGLWATGRLGAAVTPHDLLITQNFAPLWRRSDRIVATFFHDAMFFDHPEWFSRAEQIYLRCAAASLRRADLIVTSSDAEAARIRRTVPAVRDRTVAVGLGLPRSLATAAAVAPTGVDPERPFVLSVGRLNIRKNLAALVQAFVQSCTAVDHDLVVVGAADGLEDPSLAATADPRLHFVGTVSDSQLRWLYEHCALFVFPSLDEGFGLPLLEARAFGARSIASDIPAFHELGLAEELFDPHDPVALREALDRAIAREASRSRVTESTSYSWEESVQRMRDAVISMGGG